MNRIYRFTKGFYQVHPFSTPWKTQKTVRFSGVLRGQRNGALGTNRVKKNPRYIGCLYKINLIYTFGDESKTCGVP